MLTLATREHSRLLCSNSSDVRNTHALGELGTGEMVSRGRTLAIAGVETISLLSIATSYRSE